MEYTRMQHSQRPHRLNETPRFINPNHQHNQHSTHIWHGQSKSRPMKLTHKRIRGCQRGKTLGSCRRRSSSSGRLPRLAPAESNAKFSRIQELIHQSKHISTRISNITIISSKSSWIAQIEHKHFHHQNFNLIIHDQY